MGFLMDSADSGEKKGLSGSIVGSFDTTSGNKKIDMDAKFSIADAMCANIKVGEPASKQLEA